MRTLNDGELSRHAALSRATYESLFTIEALATRMRAAFEGRVLDLPPPPAYRPDPLQAFLDEQADAGAPAAAEIESLKAGAAWHAQQAENWRKAHGDAAALIADLEGHIRRLTEKPSG